MWRKISHEPSYTLLYQRDVKELDAFSNINLLTLCEMCTVTSIHARNNVTDVILVMRHSASLLYYFAALLNFVLNVTIFKWTVLTGFCSFCFQVFCANCMLIMASILHLGKSGLPKKVLDELRMA